MNRPPCQFQKKKLDNYQNQNVISFAQYSMSPSKVYAIMSLLVALTLTGRASGQSSSNSAVVTPALHAQPKDASAVLTKLPALPGGIRTVMGGRIFDVDPVLDQFALAIPGGKIITVRYDERTHLFQNGARASVLDLRPAVHASVETTLDGSRIFAVSIHVLSSVPDGDLQGQIIHYNATTGEMDLQSVISEKPIVLHVPAGTPIVPAGQLSSSGTVHAGTWQLTKGSLVNVEFMPNGSGKVVATRVEILADIGASFVFSGRVVYFNLQAGRMLILDRENNRTYDVYFQSAQLPASHHLHDGVGVKVIARFNGRHYIARSIAIE